MDDEYYMIDCWLASPFYPQNDNKMQPHWFLAKPVDMILSHFPKHHHDQYLGPPISSLAFFRLPYVRNAFFWHRMHVLAYHTQLNKDDSVFYLSFQLLQPNISCYAETESDDGTCTRGLAQCLTDDHDKRLCKVKAVLAPHQTGGWLKIYAGPKATPATTHPTLEPVSKHHYPLAFCVRIETSMPLQQSFDFVKLYVDHNEFYVQQPQCYQLYPLQTYHFVIRANRLDHRAATHHKLAIKSPSGKLSKLMYYPQDQTYDGSVTVSEAGKWSLVCLLHHTGGSYTVATWSCSISK
jgi:transglutaminase/protease-like cytokinesis protein 3